MYSYYVSYPYSNRSVKTASLPRSLPSSYRYPYYYRSRTKRPSVSMYNGCVQPQNYIHCYDYYPCQISDCYLCQYQLYNTASRTKTKPLCDYPQQYNTRSHLSNSTNNTRRGSLCNYYNNNCNDVVYESVPVNLSRLRANEYINLSNTNLSIHENCHGDI